MAELSLTLACHVRKAFPPPAAHNQVGLASVRNHKVTSTRRRNCGPPTSTRLEPTAYQAASPPWDYPRGLDVYCVNRPAVRPSTAGYFFSHALAERWVTCHPLAHRRLIHYRYLCVRDLDLTTGRTLPILAWHRPRRRPSCNGCP